MIIVITEIASRETLSLAAFATNRAPGHLAEDGQGAGGLLGSHTAYGPARVGIEGVACDPLEEVQEGLVVGLGGEGEAWAGRPELAARYSPKAAPLGHLRESHLPGVSSLQRTLERIGSRASQSEGRKRLNPNSGRRAVGIHHRPQDLAREPDGRVDSRDCENLIDDEWLFIGGETQHTARATI